ncbi:OmpA family protein [Myroides sp. N17-2]|uniref:OmpA family protein n=1 Tax=Myroides sp. N17-2 TaxID=2030799 RepID=UPI000EFC6744|nr:OmpA family protein [Myroides sp. N17-2]
MKKLHLITLGVALLGFVSVSAQKIEGRVFDKNTNTPITEGEVTFFNDKGEKIATVYTLENGMYSFESQKVKEIHKVATSVKNYSKAEIMINNLDKGAIANFGLVAASDNKGKVYTSSNDARTYSNENTDYRDTSRPIAKYDNSTLESFYYDFNSSYLTPDNKYAVDQIVSYMYNNPNAKVRVHVYFDTRGNVKYDEWLSQRRADRVVDYMISKGISPSRLMKWVETVNSNIPTKGAYSRGGNGENRRCDFDLI